MDRLTARIAGGALLLLLSTSSVLADECDVSWSNAGEDFEALFEAPFDMESDAAYLTLGVTTFVGASIIWWDDDVDRFVQRPPQSFVDHALHNFAGIASWYGANNRHAIFTHAAVAGAVALGGWIADDDYVVDTAALMAEATVYTFALNVAAKLVLGRKRPHAGTSHAFEFLVGLNDADTQSFLSGHTATAFSMAGVAAGRHPHWYVEVPAYTLATAAGWQRVDSRAHWLSDVVAGAFFGYAIAELIVDRHECAPDTESTGPMMTFSFNF